MVLQGEINQGGSDGSQRGLDTQRLNQLLAAILRLTNQKLDGLMQNVLDQVDDVLFKYADKAETNQLQMQYFDAMRVMRMQRQSLKSQFHKSFLNRYNEAIKVPGDGHHEEEEDLGLSLELLQEAVVEEEIAINNLVDKADARFHEQLFPLEARFSALFGRELARDALPVGPAIICHAFKDACEILSFDIKIKLIIYKLFDSCVMQQLQALLQEVNTRLVEEGVLPQLKHQIKVQSNPSRQRSAPTQHETHTDMDQPQWETVYEEKERCDVIPLPRSNTQAGGPVEGVRSGMGPVSVFSGFEVGNPHQLAQSLSGVQTHLLSDVEQLENQTLVPLRELIQTSIAEGRGEAEEFKTRDGLDCVDVVGMLFDLILDDASVPSRFLAILGRLQIVVLKAAILDRSFFSKQRHVARVFLNEVANLARMSAALPEHVADSHYEAVSQAVHYLLEHFEEDFEVFETALSFIEDLEADALQEIENIDDTAAAEEEDDIQFSMTDMAEETVEDEVDEASSSHTVDSQAYVEEKLNQHTIPPYAHAFLLRDWTQVMACCQSEEHDVMGAEQACKFVDELIWSLLPKTDIAQRQEMAERLPKLIDQLRQGLSVIEFSEEQINEINHELAKLHLASLKAKPAVDVAPQSAPEEAQSEEVIEEIILEQETLSENEASASEACGETLCFDEDYYQQAKTIDIGTWVDYRNAKGKIKRLKLGWRSEMMNQIVFVDRAYRAKLERSFEELAVDLKEGAITEVSEPSVVDRAVDALVRRFSAA